jgi:hypothetical protein
MAINLLSNILRGYQSSFNPAVVATIANSAQNSSIVECGGFVLCGILLPAAFTSTALTFLASVDGVNFYPVKSTSSGTALSYTVVQGTFCAINPQDFQGINYLKVVAGTAEGAARTLNLAMRGF